MVIFKGEGVLNMRRGLEKGVVYSWVTYLESPHPAFKVPYSVVLVELEEGMRIVSNLVDVNPDEIEIGMAVQVTFDEVAEGLTLPKFKKP